MPGKSIASSYENACFARENLGSHEPPAKPARQILEGYVKGGVVHLLEHFRNYCRRSMQWLNHAFALSGVIS